MLRIGVISDTHISSATEGFLQAVKTAFDGCTSIVHAGDITDISILKAFAGKNVYAVHGNMCNHMTQRSLPEHRIIDIEGYSFGICHGAGPKRNIEERLLELFPAVDCIVYGHTHIPVCHTWAETLFINPGSFQSTGPYGAKGTYGIITITDTGIEGKIVPAHRAPDLFTISLAYV